MPRIYLTRVTTNEAEHTNKDNHIPNNEPNHNNMLEVVSERLRKNAKKGRSYK